jgi:hypothetical protein
VTAERASARIKGYMHAMAQYAEQLKMQNFEQIRRNKNKKNDNKAKLRPALYVHTYQRG